MLLFSRDWDDAIDHMFIKLTSFPASCHLKTILQSGIRIQNRLGKWEKLIGKIPCNLIGTRLS